MRRLTMEQRSTLQAWLRYRSSLLRREIAGALRRSGKDRAASLAISEIERDARELREVERALARFHEPDYGVCVECGGDIPYSRLSESPAATLCVACQRRAERALAVPARPAAEATRDAKRAAVSPRRA